MELCAADKSGYGYLVRAPGCLLALLLLCASSQALGAPLPGRCVRTSLDDDKPAPMAGAAARRIRTTLDDRASKSRAAFPLNNDGRLIRLSLEEGTPTYGLLSLPHSKTRRVRTTLD